MCVGIIVPKGVKTPSETTLKLCQLENGDGGGLAWAGTGKVYWWKGIDVEQMMAILPDLPKPFFIHFRISTVGGDEPLLCHPFSVSKNATTSLTGNSKKVLMHNGHWWEWQTAMLAQVHLGRKVPKGPWSDTRAMAYMAHKYGEQIFEFIDQRVAILDNNGEFRTYGTWKERGGVLFSNLDWLPKKTKIVSKNEKLEPVPARLAGPLFLS